MEEETISVLFCVKKNLYIFLCMNTKHFYSVCVLKKKNHVSDKKKF